MPQCNRLLLSSLVLAPLAFTLCSCAASSRGGSSGTASGPAGSVPAAASGGAASALGSAAVGVASGARSVGDRSSGVRSGDEERPPLQTSVDTWPNGQPRTRETFYSTARRSRVLHGLRTTWYENGEKESEWTYRDGKRDGPSAKWWWTGGRKEVEGAWKDDREEGEWTWWQPTGVLHSRCVYRRGRIVGPKTYWNPAGAVIIEEDYDDAGHPVETRAYRDDGKLKMLGHFGRGWFTRGRKHGHWTYWDPAGNVVADGEWRYDRPWNGLCAIPAPGDAGSMIGIEVFWRFENGRKVAPLPDVHPAK